MEIIIVQTHKTVMGFRHIYNACIVLGPVVKQNRYSENIN